MHLKVVPNWSAMALNGTKLAPTWARTTQFEFTVTRIRVYSCTNPCLHPPWAPKWIKDLPNRRQDGAKHAQVGPKLAENGPKMAPVGSILGPNLQNLIRSWSKVASSRRQNWTKADFLKLIRKAMKNNGFSLFLMLNLGSICHALTPSWCQVGRNWLQVGESCFQVGSKLPRIDTSWSQGRPN